MEFVFGGVENKAGKGEEYSYQYFLLFPTLYSKVDYVTVVITLYVEAESRNRDCFE